MPSFMNWTNLVGCKGPPCEKWKWITYVMNSFLPKFGQNHNIEMIC
jgi:hypothetical protein